MRVSSAGREITYLSLGGNKLDKIPDLHHTLRDNLFFTVRFRRRQRLAADITGAKQLDFSSCASLDYQELQ